MMNRYVAGNNIWEALFFPDAVCSYRSFIYSYVIETISDPCIPADSPYPVGIYVNGCAAVVADNII